MVLAMVSIVSAIDMCQDKVKINTTCKMVSPTISCSTYNYTIMNISGSYIENGTLYPIGTKYHFNFTEPSGQYQVSLCDGTTREIYVQAEEVWLNMWEISVVLILVFVFGIYFYLANNWNFKLFSRDEKDQQSIVKAFLVLVASWGLMILIRIAQLLVDTNSADSNWTTLLNTVYEADLYINFTLTAIMMVFLLYNGLLWAGVDILKRGKR